MAGDRDVVGIAAEGGHVPVEPRHRRAHLPDELVHVDRGNERVVDDGDEHRGRLESARDEAEVLLVERPPVAAVDEHVDGPGTATLGEEHVERLAGLGSVPEVQARGSVSRVRALSPGYHARYSAVFGIFPLLLYSRSSAAWS